MRTRLAALAFAKGLVFASFLGAWTFGYHLVALGACFDCSVNAAVIYALIAAVFIPLLMIWLATSSRGRLQIYLRRIQRPSLIRLIVAGSVWGLSFGLVIFALTGSAWRIGLVFGAWMVFWLAFPRLLGGLYRHELGMR